MCPARPGSLASDLQATFYGALAAGEPEAGAARAVSDAVQSLLDAGRATPDQLRQAVAGFRSLVLRPEASAGDLAVRAATDVLAGRVPVLPPVLRVVNGPAPSGLPDRLVELTDDYIDPAGLRDAIADLLALARHYRRAPGKSLRDLIQQWERADPARVPSGLVKPDYCLLLDWQTARSTKPEAEQLVWDLLRAAASADRTTGAAPVPDRMARIRALVPAIDSLPTTRQLIEGLEPAQLEAVTLLLEVALGKVRPAGLLAPLPPQAR